MKKVLIIGSKGFIGSHLTTKLQSSNHTVYFCDVATDYINQNYFIIDASNSDFLPIFKAFKFDICINCSGAASVPDSVVNPARDYYLNTKNVFSLLEAIRQYNPECKFLNLSSAAVYGNPKILPVNENSDCSPLSPYGWHKYQSELLCKEYFQVFNIATCSVRIFSAFGPGLTKQIFWDWAAKIKLSNSLQIFGTGNESRDFIYIDDVIQAIELICNNASFRGEAINVGNGKEVFIKNAIEIFKKYSETDFEYKFSNETRPGDPLNWQADISSLEALGYKTTVPFEVGVKNYFTWLKTRK